MQWNLTRFKLNKYITSNECFKFSSKPSIKILSHVPSLIWKSRMRQQILFLPVIMITPVRYRFLKGRPYFTVRRLLGHLWEVMIGRSLWSSFDGIYMISGSRVRWVDEVHRMECIQKMFFRESPKQSFIISKKKLHLGIHSSKRYQRPLFRCYQRFVSSSGG